jgi:hypothetical protein
MPLSDTAIRNAKPKDKPYKLTGDGGEKGLYALVQPTGGKLFRFDYRFDGKRKTLALGQYPDVSLAQAREKRDEARKLIAQGTLDPGAAKQAAKAARAGAAENSFEVIAREWCAKFLKDKAPGHAVKISRRLERDIYPWVGKRPIAEIKAPELLAVLRRIESRGALETAHRACRIAGRYSVTPWRPDGRNVTLPAT